MISLIKIKIIKVRSIIFSITIAILIMSLIIFFLKNHQEERTVSVFSSIQIQSNQSFLHSIDGKVFEKIMCMSLPALDSFKEKKPLIDIRGITGVMSKALTNIDILNPETYFSMQLPVISLMKTETTFTPGVELSPMNPGIFENEHDPSESLPQPENDELERAKIEKLELISGEPLVLIYHTHTTEAYMPSEKYMYKPRDKSYHTDDLNYSVVKIGEIVASELNQLKIPTMHNKTVHDVPTYMTSYTNSLKTVEQVLKQKPSIKIVIDIHRDAPIVDPQKSREITTVEIDGITYSRFMLVIGSDKTFPHPHWEENYKFANLLNNKLEQLYPGISRGINLRSERFNQHLSKKAVLLEIGSHGNTMEESLNSAKVFAEALTSLIEELSIVE